MTILCRCPQHTTFFVSEKQIGGNPPESLASYITASSRHADEIIFLRESPLPMTTAPHIRVRKRCCCWCIRVVRKCRVEHEFRGSSMARRATSSDVSEFGDPSKFAWVVAMELGYRILIQSES